MAGFSDVQTVDAKTPRLWLPAGSVVGRSSDHDDVTTGGDSHRGRNCVLVPV